MECRARMPLLVRAWHGVYAEHLSDPISDALAVTCRIDAQRDVDVGGERSRVRGEDRCAASS